MDLQMCHLHSVGRSYGSVLSDSSSPGRAALWMQPGELPALAPTITMAGSKAKVHTFSKKRYI